MQQGLETDARDATFHRSVGALPLLILATLILMNTAGCGPSATARIDKSLTAKADAILLRSENTVRISITLTNEGKGELVIDELVIDDIEHDGFVKKSRCKKKVALISTSNAVRLAPGSSHSPSINCPVDVAALDEGTRNPLTDRGPLRWGLDVRATIHGEGGTHVVKTDLGGADAKLSGG